MSVRSNLAHSLTTEGMEAIPESATSIAGVIPAPLLPKSVFKKNMNDIFKPDDLIASYTAEEAVEDGILIKLSDGIYINTETASRLAPNQGFEGEPLDVKRLRLLLAPALTKYRNGIYFDAGATKYPDECDRYLAIYMVEEASGAKNPIWFESGVFTFPEYSASTFSL